MKGQFNYKSSVRLWRIMAVVLLSILAGCSHDDLEDDQGNNQRTLQLKVSFTEFTTNDPGVADQSRATVSEPATPAECYLKDMVIYIANASGTILQTMLCTDPVEKTENVFSVQGGDDLPTGECTVVVVANPVGGATEFHRYAPATLMDLQNKEILADISLRPTSINAPIPMFGSTKVTFDPATTTAENFVVSVALKRIYAKVRINFKADNTLSGMYLELLTGDNLARVRANTICNAYHPADPSKTGISVATGTWCKMEGTSGVSDTFTCYLPQYNTPGSAKLEIQLPLKINGTRIANNYYTIPLSRLQGNQIYDFDMILTDLGAPTLEGSEPEHLYTSYYEPFFLNQGYCFFDLQATTGNTEDVVLELYDPAGQLNLQRANDVTATATYTLISSGNKGTTRIVLNKGGGTTNTRYRIDMVTKPNNIISTEPAQQQNLRTGIASFHGSYKLTIGSKTVAEQVLDYTAKDVFYTTRFNGLELAEHNVGAYTPPSLYYPDSRGYMSAYASKVKTPPTGALPAGFNVSFNTDATGQWTCPTGYHALKIAEWQIMFPGCNLPITNYNFPDCTLAQTCDYFSITHNTTLEHLEIAEVGGRIGNTITLRTNDPTTTTTGLLFEGLTTHVGIFGYGGGSILQLRGNPFWDLVDPLCTPIRCVKTK